MNEYVEHLDDLIDMGEMQCHLQECFDLDEATVQASFMQWLKVLATRHGLTDELVALCEDNEVMQESIKECFKDSP